MIAEIEIIEIHIEAIQEIVIEMIIEIDIEMIVEIEIDTEMIAVTKIDLEIIGIIVEIDLEAIVEIVLEAIVGTDIGMIAEIDIKVITETNIEMIVEIETKEEMIEIITIETDPSIDTNLPMEERIVEKEGISIEILETIEMTLVGTETRPKRKKHVNIAEKRITQSTIVIN